MVTTFHRFQGEHQPLANLLIREPLSDEAHIRMGFDVFPQRDAHCAPRRLSCQGCDDRIDMRATNELLPCIAWIILEVDDPSRLEFYHLLFDNLATVPCGLHDLAYRLALRHHLI